MAPGTPGEGRGGCQKSGHTQCVEQPGDGGLSGVRLSRGSGLWRARHVAQVSEQRTQGRAHIEHERATCRPSVRGL